MSIASQSITAARLTISERVAAGTLAVILGLSILFVVGFSSSSIAHNAAHDTRHAIGFPCH